MQYRIYLAPFPFDDLSASKYRPVLCLTEPFGPHRHIVIAFITSKPSTEENEFNIRLGHDQSGFEKTGLKVDSILRINRLVSVSTNIIKRELGELPKESIKLVKSRLKILFQL